MESPFIYIAIPIIVYAVFTIICLYFALNYLLTAKKYDEKRMNHPLWEWILVILVAFIPFGQLFAFLIWIAHDTDSFLKKEY